MQPSPYVYTEAVLVSLKQVSISFKESDASLIQSRVPLANSWYSDEIAFAMFTELNLVSRRLSTSLKYPR